MQPINDYPNYLLSKDGRVFSTITSKYLKPYLVMGYPTVDLINDGGIGKKLIHRLLAEHFIPNPNNLPQVNHIDGVKTNNSLSNLEWVSGSDNVRHAHTTGLTKKRASIPYEDIPNIILKLRNGANWNDIQKLYNVSDHSTIRKLIKRDFERKGELEEYLKLSYMIKQRNLVSASKKLAVTVGGCLTIYDSLNAAARALDINPATIHKNLGKSYKGMEFNYA